MPPKDEIEKFIAQAKEFLKLFGNPEWIGTKPQTIDQHVEDFRQILITGEEKFGQTETEMHYVGFGAGNKFLVTAQIGNTPSSADRAKAITGFLRHMPKLLDALEENERLKERVDELLTHTNHQLFEIRDQRALIKKLNGQVRWLCDRIPTEVKQAF